MATKPNAKDCMIKEQIIEDKVSGLSMMFSAYQNGGSRLRVCSDALPLGNRDFIFGPEGELGGTGTATGRCCMSWLTPTLDPDEADRKRAERFVATGGQILVDEETGKETWIEEDGYVLVDEITED